MAFKRYLFDTLNLLLRHCGYEIIGSPNLYEWQKNPQILPSYKQSQLPKEATDYLIPNNPRLRELQSKYSSFSKEILSPLVWKNDHVKPYDMIYFRGDNAYVWQLRGFNMNVLGYALTTYYVKSIDGLGLLEKLEEDDFFGIYTFNIDNRLVSRDLLDSIIEIYFLEKHLNISNHKNLTILDIGAGYGRSAHRMLNALPNIAQYLCTDAFPISNFICEYYLRFRNLEDRAKVVPIYEIEHVLQNTNVDIAINIHSFSECRISAIEWWLSVLAKYRIKNLMIVPNQPDLLTNDDVDFGNIIEKHRYKLIAKNPKYSDPIVQKYGIKPAYHYLFELRNNKST